jgi:hypothetical protein
MNTPYEIWLKEHLTAAKVHYTELCKLDDKELAQGDSSEYYEQAHQMFGYIAALEKCLKQTGLVKAAVVKKAKASAKVSRSVSKSKR